MAFDPNNTKVQEALQSQTDRTSHKTWEDYEEAIKYESELPSEKGQKIMSMAVEPSMKEALQTAGSIFGRKNGGTKTLVRVALSEFLKNNPALFDPNNKKPENQKDITLNLK